MRPAGEGGVMTQKSRTDWIKIATFALGLLASACVLYAKLNLLDWRVAQVEKKLDTLIERTTYVEDVEIAKR